MKKFTDKINESVEGKIPTANELFEQYHGFEADSSSRDIISLMVEFAKLHVEAALKAASDKASLTDFAYEFLQEGAYDAIDKDTILNAYPVENIK
jgi:hypothetical protein